jgi:hypothetical protein
MSAGGHCTEDAVPANTDYSDTLHTGQHQFEVIPRVPVNSFGDAQISAANPLGVTKVTHQYIPCYAQPNGSAAASETKAVFVARSAGTVRAIEAGIITAAVGAATVTIDLKKNGVSILTSVITIDNSKVAYAKTAGAISSAAYVAGDVFTLVITATAGGGTLPQGLFVDTTFAEGSG